MRRRHARAGLAASAGLLLAVAIAVPPPSGSVSTVIDSVSVVNPAAIPATVLSETPTIRGCQESMDFYGVDITDEMSTGSELTGKTPTVESALEVARSGGPVGRLTPQSAYRLYPAVVTYDSASLSSGVHGPITQRPMWVAEVSNVQVPDRAVGYVPSSARSSSAPVVFNTQVGFIDPASGVIAFSLTCMS